MTKHPNVEVLRPGSRHDDLGPDAFGLGGIGAAVLGGLADRHGIVYVYRLCAYLPLLGMVAAFLPDIERRPARNPA